MLGFLLTIAAPLCQAQTIFARFAGGGGDWAGGVVRPGLTGEWVPLLSASFGFSNTVSFSGSGGQPTAGRAQFKQIAITKTVSKISPRFFASLMSSTPVPSTSGADVIIDFLQSVGGTMRTVMRLELEPAFFENLDCAVSVGDSDLSENVSINYGSFRITVWPVQGNSLGSPISSGWSVISDSSQLPF